MNTYSIGPNSCEVKRNPPKGTISSPRIQPCNSSLDEICHMPRVSTSWERKWKAWPRSSSCMTDSEREGINREGDFFHILRMEAWFGFGTISIPGGGGRTPLIYHNFGTMIETSFHAWFDLQPYAAGVLSILFGDAQMTLISCKSRTIVTRIHRPTHPLSPTPHPPQNPPP